MSADSPALHPSSRSREDRWIAIGLAVLTLAVFVRAMWGEFLDWDDWQMVSSNLDLRPGHLTALLAYWYQPHLGLFIPLTYYTYAFLESLSFFVSGTLEPYWFHGANILLHAANGLALWKILTRLSGHSRASAVGAAIFLVHPIQVEAVAWISSLNTVLAAFLVLLSLRVYLACIEVRGRRKCILLFTLCCLTSAAAMLAKPSACVAPFIAFALHALVSKQDIRRGAVLCLILLLVQAPFAWIAHTVQRGDLRQATGAISHLAIVLDTVGFYIAKVFLPSNLAFDYGRSPSRISPGLPMALGAAFLVLVATLGVLHRKRSTQWLLAGTLIFLATLMPVLGLVPFSFQFYSTVADRYAYLAMIGPAIIVTNLLAPSANATRLLRLRARFIAASIVTVALAVFSYVQAGVWTSDSRLFEQALAINPKSIAANQTLGFLAARDAQRPGESPQMRSRLLAMAMTYDNRALAVDPDNPVARFNRANLFLRTGRPTEALPDYAVAAGHLDEEAQLQNNWGIACLQLNQIVEAMRHFDAAIAADPSFADAFANAGTAYLRSGQLGRAREKFSRALALDPSQVQALAGMTKLRESGL